MLSGQKIDENSENKSSFLDLGTLAAMLNSSKVPPKQTSELSDHQITKSDENIQINKIDTSQKIDQQTNEQMNNLMKSFLNQSFDSISTNNLSSSINQDKLKTDKQQFDNPRGSTLFIQNLSCYD